MDNPFEPTTTFEQGQPHLEWVAEKANAVRHELGKYLIGQDELIDQLLTGIFANGHLLLEGVPGVAKTLVSKCIAKVLDVDFSRIQFTPDLMPSDVLGTSIFDMKEARFHFKKGPIFSNIVLIDEINRSPAKTQAALFEVMEERQITYDGTTYPMEFPFLVIATQNPIEQEGTYPLPEAQLDRFLMKVHVDYPNLEEEVALLTRYTSNFKNPDLTEIKPVFNRSELQQIQRLTEEIHIEERLIRYCAELIHKTRNHFRIFMGASPRGGLALVRTSKAIAALSGRGFVVPDDIQRSAFSVLNHRIILTPEAEMEGIRTHDLIQELVQTIEVPR